MDASLDRHIIPRFLDRVEKADKDLDYLTELRDFFDSMDLASGGLVSTRCNSFQSVLWNAPDDRIVLCSNELTRHCRHPTIKISTDRQYPFSLNDFETEFSKEPVSSQLLRKFKNIGLSETYALPVHVPGNSLYTFVIARRGMQVSQEALLALQAACQGVIGKMLRTAETTDTCPMSLEGRKLLMLTTQGVSIAQVAEQLGVHITTCALLRDAMLEEINAKKIAHPVMHKSGRSRVPDPSVSHRIPILLTEIDALRVRYDEAMEVRDKKLAEELLDQLTNLVRLVDEAQEARGSLH